MPSTVRNTFFFLRSSLRRQFWKTPNHANLRPLGYLPGSSTVVLFGQKEKLPPFLVFFFFFFSRLSLTTNTRKRWTSATCCAFQKHWPWRKSSSTSSLWASTAHQVSLWTLSTTPLRHFESGRNLTALWESDDTSVIQYESHNNLQDERNYFNLTRLSIDSVLTCETQNDILIFQKCTSWSHRHFFKGRVFSTNFWMCVFVYKRIHFSVRLAIHQEFEANAVLCFVLPNQTENSSRQIRTIVLYFNWRTTDWQPEKAWTLLFISKNYLVRVN